MGPGGGLQIGLGRGAHFGGKRHILPRSPLSHTDAAVRRQRILGAKEMLCTVLPRRRGRELYLFVVEVFTTYLLVTDATPH